MADDAAEGAAKAGSPGGVPTAAGAAGPAPAATADAAAATRITARQLLLLVIPAIAVGVVSAVMLVGATRIAKVLEDVIWTTIPDAIGVSSSGPAWIFLVLTLAGLVIGLVVAAVPGHAGPDPATIELAAPPLPLVHLPGLALVLILLLASGVSLGPENPILAVNIGLAVGLGLRLIPRIPVPVWSGLAFAGTIGAMFGTPVAAALLLTELPGNPRIPLWDRLFAPLVAAAAGTITVDLLGGESFALVVAPFPGLQLIDLFTGSVIAVGAALVAMVAVLAFPLSYRAFKRLGHPLVAFVIGGALLGVLGAIGGPITLFKGLTQMQELSATVTNYTAGGLAAMAVMKLIAVVIASTAGFRGGRIFPSVFAAVAMGLAIYTFFPQIPESVAISASLIGVLVAVTRSGWIALFMGGLLVGDFTILPLLCVIILPAWLVVTGRPEMVAKGPEPDLPSAAPQAPAAA